MEGFLLLMGGVLIGLFCGGICGADWQAQRKIRKRSPETPAPNCEAELYIADVTMCCRLHTGHDGRHEGYFNRQGAVELTWECDERALTS